MELLFWRANIKTREREFALPLRDSLRYRSEHVRYNRILWRTWPNLPPCWIGRSCARARSLLANLPPASVLQFGVAFVSFRTSRVAQRREIIKQTKQTWMHFSCCSSCYTCTKICRQAQRGIAGLLPSGKYRLGTRNTNRRRLDR